VFGGWRLVVVGGLLVGCWIVGWWLVVGDWRLVVVGLWLLVGDGLAWGLVAVLAAHVHICQLM
jgi:hypothetical protein